MKYLILILALIVGLFSGCASGGPRTVSLQTKATRYAAQSLRETGELRVSITDQRADRSIDAILSQAVATCVEQEIIQALTQSKVVGMKDGVGTKITITGELTKLEWLVPGYQAMLKKVFVASFLTGGLGGVAYGSTETPVVGNVALKIRVSLDGSEILVREIVGTHEEKMAKLKCDTMTTKSTVTGLALSDAVEKIVREIDVALASSGDFPSESTVKL